MRSSECPNDLVDFGVLWSVDYQQDTMLLQIGLCCNTRKALRKRIPRAVNRDDDINRLRPVVSLPARAAIPVERLGAKAATKVVDELHPVDCRRLG